MRYIKVLVVVFLFFVCIVFFVQNTGSLSETFSLRFHLLGIDWESSPTPIYTFVLVAFLVGVIVSMFYFLLEKLRQGKELKRARAYISDLEEELNSLRNMPLEQSNYGNDNEIQENEA
ncbi:MAG TPA: LapA family protein [Desulfohalobiaceae bacterium]|nr:LapA family protein [Desulfohalobiaceae bacterium]